MRSRSSSPNTPSSDSSPSSSDLPLAAPNVPELASKELEETQLFNTYINDSAFDAASTIVSAPAVPYEGRLHSVLSSAYHVPPPVHAHVVRPSATALAPPLPLDEDLDEPEPELETKHEGQVVGPSKESCVNLPIRVRNVPLQGAKSRVETQLKVTIDLVWDQTPRSHFHHPPSLSGYPQTTSDANAPTVGSWDWLVLPPGSATKRRGRKDAKIVPTPEQTLTLHTIVNVASSPHTAARACKKCLAREAKRAERKRRGPNDPDPTPIEPGVGLEDDKIVLYNCADVLDFKSGTVDLPVRLTCYCRHHSEKVGFCITFILRDYTGRTVGTGVTPPILITDDHKSTARKVQVQAQQQAQPAVVSARKGSKDKGTKQHRMQKPYARSAGTSRASSLGLGAGLNGAGTTVVKEEANNNAGFGGNGVSSYGTPSTQGYMSPPPQSPSHYAATNSGMFTNGFQLGDGMIPAGPAALLSPTRSAFLSPPRSPVHSRAHTRPSSRMHSPVQTRSHSPVRGMGLVSPAHSRSDSRNGQVPGLEGVLGELELGALGSDMLMSVLAASGSGEGLLGAGNESLLGAGLGMDDAFASGQFTPADTPMLDGSFDPMNPSIAPGAWEGMLSEFAPPKSQSAMYVEHPRASTSSSWEPWAPESMDLALPDPMPIPRISRVVPNSGPIQGGIEVTLLGENFTRAYECKFGDYVATETAVWGVNTLVCLLPPAAQPGAVSVCIKDYEHVPRVPGERDVLFTYKDDSIDRSLMELALRVVGQRMTGRQEEPCNIARRIVAVGEMQPNSNMVTTRLAQSVIESTDTAPGPSRQEELVQFLTLLDVPLVGSRTVSTNTAVSLQNETGHTLLHLCAVLGYDALATDLLKRGADPDVRDATGQTALHLAALRGQVTCARVLLDGGADTEIVNAYGLAPEDVAREHGNADILALLEGAEEESQVDEAEEGEEIDYEASTVDEAGVEADESDLEDERTREVNEAEEIASCSDAESENSLYAEQPSRPSLDSIPDVRPSFLGDVPKVPSTWFHRTFSHLQPQKAWPLTQINLPGVPALPAWPVTIPWPQTPEKGAFDLGAFRGFLGAKQQPTDAGVRTIYPPAPQPDGTVQGLNQAQLRTRLARRLGYYPTEVTDREVRAYTYHSQKMRKLKKDRMLVLFWLPILLIVIAWGLYQSVPMAVHAVVHTVKGFLPLASR
ncbi:SPT3 Dosage dependent suppressor of Ty-induced promoter mutations-like protein [Ceratobasidium sp. 392]|nr:SPT3 Dosage dependent suppressor of Ty-induced promoter mutations-like protein [Ceratobasidium sp. 392]